MKINTEALVKRTTIFANIFICIQVLTIIIAYMGYESSKNAYESQMQTIRTNEQTKNSLETINKIYNLKFIEFFLKLNKSSDMEKSDDFEAFYYVLNTYYVVAVVYNSGIADNILIGNSISEGVNSFVELPIYTSFNDKKILFAKSEIDKMRNHINRNRESHEN